MVQNYDKNNIMIKIIHTSDWHAGKINSKESRREDLEYALKQIETFIKDEKVDCLLVCGDIFDKPTVSPQDMAIILAFLISVNSYGTKTIMTSGNHDSRDFLGSMKGILKIVNVDVFHKVEEKIDNAFLELELGRDQKEKILFFAFPYLNPLIPSGIMKRFQSSSASETYIDFVSDYLTAASQILKDKKNPAIMISHIAVAEAKPSGTEKEISMKADFCVPHAKFPSSFIYYALGHIHRRQQVSETKRIYYSGSLFQIDFGEENDDEKGFYLITIKDEYIDKIEFQKIGLKRRMKTYKFDLSKHGPDFIMQELTKDKSTLKRIFLYFDENQKYLVSQFLTKINTVEGVISVNFEGKEQDRNTIEVSSSLEQDTSTDIITLYEKFYSEVKGGDLDFFGKSIRPYIMRIIEEYEKQGMT